MSATTLRYPFKAMRITQNYNGSTSHKPHVTGTPKDYPIDEACENTGRSPIYAPCNMKVIKIYGVGTGGTNTLWLTSTAKVLFADGTNDYLTMMLIHPNDSDLKKLKLNQVIKKDAIICYEGTDGATGNHIHLSCGSGKVKGNGWVKNSRNKWVLDVSGETKKPEDVFYLDTDFTTVYDKGGIVWKPDTKTERYITTARLNCRQKPDITSKVVKVYDKGVTVKVSEIQDNWCHTTDGWSYKEYLRKV